MLLVLQLTGITDSSDPQMTRTSFVRVAALTSETRDHTDTKVTLIVGEGQEEGGRGTVSTGRTILMKTQRGPPQPRRVAYYKGLSLYPSSVGPTEQFACIRFGTKTELPGYLGS